MKRFLGVFMAVTGSLSSVQAIQMLIDGQPVMPNFNAGGGYGWAFERRLIELRDAPVINQTGAADPYFADYAYHFSRLSGPGGLRASMHFPTNTAPNGLYNMVMIESSFGLMPKSHYDYLEAKKNLDPIFVNRPVTVKIYSSPSLYKVEAVYKKHELALVALDKAVQEEAIEREYQYPQDGKGNYFICNPYMQFSPDNRFLNISSDPLIAKVDYQKWPSTMWGNERFFPVKGERVSLRGGLDSIYPGSISASNQKGNLVDSGAPILSYHSDSAEYKLTGFVNMFSSTDIHSTVIAEPVINQWINSMILKYSLQGKGSGDVTLTSLNQTILKPQGAQGVIPVALLADPNWLVGKKDALKLNIPLRLPIGVSDQKVVQVYNCLLDEVHDVGTTPGGDYVAARLKTPITEESAFVRVRSYEQKTEWQREMNDKIDHLILVDALEEK